MSDAVPLSPENPLRLPWHRETIGHLSTAGIVKSVAGSLDFPLAEGVPPKDVGMVQTDIAVRPTS